MSQSAKEHLETATRASQAAVNAAFEEGKKVGIELGVQQERDRVKKALFSDSPETPADQKPQPSKLESAVAAGSLMAMARLMFAKDRKRSFSVSDVIEYFSEHYRAPIDASQARTLLKVLARFNEAQRLDRGVYSAGPKLVVPTTIIGGA
jgi:hypothetical protein